MNSPLQHHTRTHRPTKSPASTLSAQPPHSILLKLRRVPIPCRARLLLLVLVAIAHHGMGSVVAALAFEGVQEVCASELQGRTFFTVEATKVLLSESWMSCCTWYVLVSMRVYCRCCRCPSTCSLRPPRAKCTASRRDHTVTLSALSSESMVLIISYRRGKRLRRWEKHTVGLLRDRLCFCVSSCIHPLHGLV